MQRFRETCNCNSMANAKDYGNDGYIFTRVCFHIYLYNSNISLVVCGISEIDASIYYENCDKIFCG